MSTTTNSDHGPGAIVTVSEGTWSIYYRRAEGSTASRVTLSGYGEDWREKLDDLEPGALVVDLRPLPDARRFELVVAGPMLAVETDPGVISRPFGLAARVDRSARFYGAGSLDTLSVEDYAELAREWGAEVYPAHDADARTRTVAEVAAEVPTVEQAQLYADGARATA